MSADDCDARERPHDGYDQNGHYENGNGIEHEEHEEIPEPEVLPVRNMLEEFDVNVLAPLVRCSKREYISTAGAR